MFKDVVEKELKALPPETIQEIIREAIVKYLNDSDIIKNLFTIESRREYGGPDRYPTPVLHTAAQTFNLSPAFKDVEDKMVKTLTEQYPDVLIATLSQLVVKGMTQTPAFQGDVHNMFQHMAFQLKEDIRNGRM